MFQTYFQTMFTLRNSLIRLNRNNILLNLLHLNRSRFVSCGIHGTTVYRKTKHEISSEPIKFTTSPANTPSLILPADVNRYQKLIVTVSLAVMLVYFCCLREENDIDELLNKMLFETVPAAEEPHITQMVTVMKDKGLDTIEAEERLKELVDKRLSKEQQQNRTA